MILSICYHYKGKKINCGFLALQDYEVTVITLIAKDDIQWIV